MAGEPRSVLREGVIGGLLWLGVLGLFVGPVILAVTATLLEQWVSAGGGPVTETPPAAAPRAVHGGGGITPST